MGYVAEAMQRSSPKSCIQRCEPATRKLLALRGSLAKLGQKDRIRATDTRFLTARDWRFIMSALCV
jgi:hypothetical protein